MIAKLIILFTIIPLIELSLLIKVGQYIGVGSTLLIVILTGVVGAYLTKEQGFRTISKIRYELENGRIPADPLLDGVLILAGGLLLVTPGLITDTIGFIVLIPASRTIVKEYLKKKIQERFIIY